MSLLTAIWVVALILSVGAILWMCALMVMRVLHQRRADRRRRDRAEVERCLVSLLQGRCDVHRELGPYAGRARLMAESLLDFLAIVSGHDRRIVLSALEEIYIPETFRQRLDRGSLAGRLVALEALSVFPGPETDAALTQAAASRRQVIRLAALKSLHAVRGGLPLGRLLGDLEAGRLRASAVVGEFVRTLVATSPAAAAAELRSGLLAPTAQVLLIDGLALAGDYSVAPALISLAGSSHPEVRAAAITAMGKLMHPVAEPTVAAALEDDDWRVRAAAAEAIGAARFGGLAEAVTERLADPVWRVRFLAGTALTRLGSDGRARLLAASSGPVAEAAQTASLVLAEHGVIA